RSAAAGTNAPSGSTASIRAESAWANLSGSSAAFSAASPNIWAEQSHCIRRKTLANHDPQEETILVLAPTGRDAAMASQVLTKVGLAARACHDVEDLRRLAPTGIGALLLTDEALDDDAIQCLLDLLDQQPRWSDLPLLLLVSSEASAEGLLSCF